MQCSQHQFWAAHRHFLTCPPLGLACCSLDAAFSIACADSLFDQGAKRLLLDQIIGMCWRVRLDSRLLDKPHKIRQREEGNLSKALIVPCERVALSKQGRRSEWQNKWKMRSFLRKTLLFLWCANYLGLQHTLLLLTFFKIKILCPFSFPCKIYMHSKSVKNQEFPLQLLPSCISILQCLLLGLRHRT